ncbi:MAG: hypothetical protein H6R10_2653 [Rhodocyclaceae bacterium]|nr:hypothetical protein [Rhodocyclaceae bacterium]
MVNAYSEDVPPNQVAVTLQIDAGVYEAFLRKAGQANMEVETLLSNTLAIVLGCRFFTQDRTCPIPMAAKGGAGSPHRQ